MDITIKHNINRFGKGTQPMLFAHGYGCDQMMWRFTAPDFEEDYDIILFDHIGSGKSDLNYYDFEKYDSLQGYADDIITICEELELKDVIFVGHSVSAIIGVLAAKERPDLFSKLILLSPSPCYVENENYTGFSEEDLNGIIELLESNYLGWTSSITPLIAGNDADTTRELKNSFCRMNPKIAKHFAKVAFLGDNRDDLSRVTIPSLIIQCNPDRIAPLEVGQYVHTQIKDSCLTVLDEPGHCSHLTAPQKTINAIKSYLKQDE
jgi:sigma-B regulation protein RsbQ